MALPRLRAELSDGREVARLLRGALRHEIEVVRLSWPPATAGQHLLEVDVPGNTPVVLLADPIGDETIGGHPLHVRPVTREQMATLFDLAERLDERPSQSIFPEDDSRAPAESEIAESAGEATLVETDPFGAIESVVPPPPSSLHDVGAPALLSEHSLIGHLMAGRYAIESVIGSGASAAVFRARHIDLERFVAVKVLHEQNRTDAHFVRRFKAEARAASKLEHRNVTRVLDFGQEAGGLLYIVMELLTGRSLEAILAADGHLSQAMAVKVAMQACSALACAHDEGIIHRDVKPENIVLVPFRDDDGHASDIVKVCDFGLAKLRDGDPEQGGETTMLGTLCGSPAFMSPEQTRGEPLDPRTDVYSLGVTLYETLTGKLPHDSDNLAELFLRKVTETPAAPSAVVPDIHPELDAVVLKAIAGDRSDRYATARAFRDDLRKVLEILSK